VFFEHFCRIFVFYLVLTTTAEPFDYVVNSIFSVFDVLKHIFQNPYKFCFFFVCLVCVNMVSK
jgi:hypothetical protein